MSYIAFDLGASSGKVFLGGIKDGKLYLNEVHRFENGPVDINGGLYWDIIRIYSELKEGIRKAGREAPDDIVSIGIDSFCNDFALVSENGELLTPVRCYRDPRTEKYKEAIYAKMPPEEIYKRSGNQIAPFNTLMELAAMIEAGQKYLLEGAYKLLFVPDLLLNFLTGEFVSEYTLSSVSQMYSFEKDDFDDEILSAFGIPRRIFGRLTKCGEVMGRVKPEVARELDIPRINGVSVCEHDTGSAFLSAKAGSVIISSGTWALVGVESDRPIINDYAFKMNAANEGGYNGEHHRLIKNVMGFWILQQVREQLKTQGVNISFAQMAKEAETAEPFRWCIDVDDIEFFTPWDMIGKIQRKCDAEFGSHPQTVGELTRCVSESLALKYRYVTEQLETLAGKTCGDINIIGGGSSNALVCGFAASATGKRVVAGPSEASALGNIMVQMIADNAISGIEEGRRIIQSTFEFKEYFPKDTEKWDEYYVRFKKLYSL